MSANWQFFKNITTNFQHPLKQTKCFNLEFLILDKVATEACNFQNWHTELHATNKWKNISIVCKIMVCQEKRRNISGVLEA